MSTAMIATTDTAAAKPRKRSNTLLWIAGPALVLAIAGYFYLSGGRYVSTDNAYVQADQITISPQIAGRVAEVFVRENQAVKAGDLLFRIDEEPLKISVQRLQAQAESVRSMLDGARKNAPKITCETTACPEGKPVIPPGRGGLGELVANAPLLLERLATLTERLTLVMSDENQAALTGILQNTNKVTADLAAASPQLQGTIQELENTLREAGETLDAFEQVTKSTDAVINQDYEVWHLQPILFVLESFDQLVTEFRAWASGRGLLPA